MSQVIDVTGFVRKFNNSEENTQIIAKVIKREIDDYLKSKKFENMVEKINLEQSSKQSFLESFAKNMLITNMVSNQIDSASEKAVMKEIRSQLGSAVTSQIEHVKPTVIKEITKQIKNKLPSIIKEDSQPIIRELVTNYVNTDLNALIYNICLGHIRGLLDGSTELNNILLNHQVSLNTSLENNARGITLNAEITLRNIYDLIINDDTKILS